MKKIILAIVILLSTPCWSAFTFVNAQGANSASSSSLATATWASTAGDTVVCGIAMFTQTINTVTDANALAFTKSAVVSTPGGGKVYTAWAFNIGANATYSVTVTATGGPNELSIACAEFTPPAATTVSLDVSNSAISSTVSVAAVTAGDLVFGAASQDNTAVFTAGAGYTMPTNGLQPATGDAATHQPIGIEYNLNATGGTTTVNFTGMGAGDAIWGVAFKATATGGAAPGSNKKEKLEQMDPPS